MPNRLILETSPYLRQHADNPVDWYPWGTEALERARNEDKPIFLSIGYSACHWCHVMAHESFENESTATIMNEYFVNVKVDREERPDLDRIYMAAVVAMTGSGGWPMSVFLTPDCAPFHGGTYFPPVPRSGMPAFPRVLLAVADAWKNRRAEILENAGNIVRILREQEGEGLETPEERDHPVTAQETSVAADDSLRRTARTDIASSEGELDQAILDRVLRDLYEYVDWKNGGWGGAPKFPQPMVLEYLLRYFLRTSDENVWRMIDVTLEAMARGGIYDQLGGGFHRYSVDALWQVPHFEKMLYDNAQLARVYLHAWQLNQETFYRSVCEETLDYVLREMTGLRGEFFSTQDADTEGQEGKFFLWTATEVERALREAGMAEDVEEFTEAYLVSAAGNVSSDPWQHFRGKNVLRYAGQLKERDRFLRARKVLLQDRERRVRPGVDRKVLTSWNGLMLAAFAEAGIALARGDFLEAARRNADFLMAEVYRKTSRLADAGQHGGISQSARHGKVKGEGSLGEVENLATGESAAESGSLGEEPRLYHTWTNGRPGFNDYLEDYSCLIEGFLALYQATFEEVWYVRAKRLAEAMCKHFRAPVGFFDTSDDHESLVVRPREVQDNAVPSGNAMAATVLLKLAGLSTEPRFADAASSMLRSMQNRMVKHPLAFGQWLIAFDYAVSAPRQIAIVGRLDAPDTLALLDVCRRGYRPHQVISAGLPGPRAVRVPLLENRPQVEGQATAYVCRGFTCLPPETDPEELGRLVE